MRAAHDRAVRSATIHRMVLTATFFVLALVHLLLFLFYPPLRANLYVSAASLFAASFAFFSLRDWSALPGSVGEWLWTSRLEDIGGVLTFLLMLRLTHWLVYPRMTRAFVALSVLAVAYLSLHWFRPLVFESYGAALGVLICAEILRTIATARFGKQRMRLAGSWIMLVGIVPVTIASAHGFLAFDLGAIRPVWDFGTFPVPYYAGVAFVISISVFLAYNYSRVNKDLESRLNQIRELTEQTIRQEVEQARLKAENERRAHELEEARRLQLSMLPERVPTHPCIELGIYSATAVEVGGDYYDFWVRDGLVTAAIGDATGHGLQAGTLVTATKSLLNALASKANPSEVLRRASRALREMHFRKVFMAMTLVKLEGREVRIAAGGMPRPLLYRAATGRVETLDLVGLPLGVPVELNPTTTTIVLEQGDVLLLASDGLAELRNPAGDMLGYDRLPDLLAHAAADVEVRGFEPSDTEPSGFVTTTAESTKVSRAQQIVDRLAAFAGRWADGRPRGDDVTILCLRAR